jgi:hypothetical protein
MLILNVVLQYLTMEATTFDTIKVSVEEILTFDLNTQEAFDTHTIQIFNTLKQLEAAIEDIAQRANNYPQNTIMGDGWMDGYGYASLARALTLHLQAQGTNKCLPYEGHASVSWLRATLAVCSHYRNLVGPAMITHASYHERTDNHPHALLMYTAVVKDFVCLLESWVDSADVPNEDDRIALESLKIAVEKLLSSGTSQVDEFDLTAVKTQVDAILLR